MDIAQLIKACNEFGADVHFFHNGECRISVAIDFQGILARDEYAFPSLEVAYGWLLAKKGFLPNKKDWETKKANGGNA